MIDSIKKRGKRLEFYENGEHRLLSHNKHRNCIRCGKKPTVTLYQNPKTTKSFCEAHLKEEKPKIYVLSALKGIWPS